MMKIAGFGLLGLAALMVIPSGVSADVAPMIFYGTADVQLADADGNVQLLQTVHNQLTDEGEAFLIDQVFDTGATAYTGDQRVSSICLLADSYTDLDSADLEALNDVNPDGDTGTLAHTGIAKANRATCGGNTSGDVAKNGSTAVIGPVQFEAGTGFDAGQTVSGFAVCANGGNATHCDNTHGDPGSPSLGDAEALLAVINISDVGLPNSGDTLTVTYTFDISTDNA